MSIKNKKKNYDQRCKHCGHWIALDWVTSTGEKRYKDRRKEHPYICNWDSAGEYLKDTAENYQWHEPAHPLILAAQKAVIEGV